MWSFDWTEQCAMRGNLSIEAAAEGYASEDLFDALLPHRPHTFTALRAKYLSRLEEKLEDGSTHTPLSVIGETNIHYRD